jgi:hypothetical protein
MDNGINVTKLHDYKNDNSYKEEFEEIKKELEMVYISKKINRSNSASVNDSLLLCYLYEENVPDDEILIDPTLLTWDGVFADFRKKYFQLHPKKPYWHLFRPSKFLDHNSLLSFKINSEAISNDLMSITQDEFDLKNKIQGLTEILSKIADMRTTEGTKLSKGLADIRTNYIYDLKGKDVDKSVFVEQQPVDDLVCEVSSYYSTNKSKHSIEDFKVALKSAEFVNSFLEYISSQLDLFKETKKFSSDYKKQTDSLLSVFLSSNK